MSIGCTKKFEYGSDKFSLESIVDGGLNSTWYYFKKTIDKDTILESKSQNAADGYELKGDTNMLGRWDIYILDKEAAPYICANFCCYSSADMGDTKLNIYFNYTVASTGERKEEVWQLDFGQEPFEDKRGK